jgi:hypothetical protein
MPRLPVHSRPLFRVLDHHPGYRDGVPDERPQARAAETAFAKLLTSKLDRDYQPEITTIIAGLSQATSAPCGRQINKSKEKILVHLPVA